MIINKLPENISSISLNDNVHYTIFVDNQLPYNYYEIEKRINQQKVFFEENDEHRVSIESDIKERIFIAVYLKQIDSISLHSNANLNGVIMQKYQSLNLINYSEGEIKLEGKVGDISIVVANRGNVNTSSLHAENGVLHSDGSGIIKAYIKKSFEFVNMKNGEIIVNSDDKAQVVLGKEGRYDMNLFFTDSLSEIHLNKANQFNQMNSSAVYDFFKKEYNLAPTLKDISISPLQATIKKML